MLKLIKIFYCLHIDLYFLYVSLSLSSPFCRWRPLLYWLWYEPMWQEGADVAEQRVRCLRPGPARDCRKHRLLALPGGGHHPSPQPEHGDTHVPPLWPLEGLLLGW